MVVSCASHGPRREIGRLSMTPKSRRRLVQFALIACMTTAMPGAALFAQVPGGRRGGAATQPAFIPQGYDDHQNMMDQLGVTKLRPGESGQNQERFTEEKAN